MASVAKRLRKHENPGAEMWTTTPTFPTRRDVILGYIWRMRWTRIDLNEIVSAPTNEGADLRLMLHFAYS